MTFLYTDRVFAGEAAVAEAAGGFRRDLVQRVQAEKAQAVCTDQRADLLHRVPAGDQVVLVWNVRAEIAGETNGGAEERICTSAAPASRSRDTICREVVPRTIESSIMTTRLPCTQLRSAPSLMRTACSRLCWRG